MELDTQGSISNEHWMAYKLIYTVHKTGYSSYMSEHLDRSTTLSYRYFDIDRLSVWTEGLVQKLISYSQVKATNIMKCTK